MKYSSFAVETAEQINGQMGVSAAEFVEDLPKPDPASEGKILVASADCKGVPLVKKDAQKVAAFETAKKSLATAEWQRLPASIASIPMFERQKISLLPCFQMTAIQTRFSRNALSLRPRTPLPTFLIWKTMEMILKSRSAESLSQWIGLSNRLLFDDV